MGRNYGKQEGQKKRVKISDTSIPHDRMCPRLPDSDMRVIVTSPFVTSSKISRTLKGRHDYTEVFLCHAQFCVLVEKYGVEQLKASSSEPLHRDFRHYECAERPSSASPNLFSYVPEHTTAMVSSADNQLARESFFS